MTRRQPLLLAALACALASGCAADGSPPTVGAAPTSTAAEPGTTSTTSTRAPTTTTVAPEPQPVPADTLVEPETPRPSTVAVVGDSLTVSAREEILYELVRNGFHVLAIDGLESRRMNHGGSGLPPGAAAVEEILATSQPDLWVIALGTNDVASAGSLDTFGADMDAILQRIPDGTPVIWVDLWIRDRATSIAEANRLIRTELRRWSGGAAVVDWYAHGEEAGIITDDGVHLTAAGQQLFADSIVSAIDDLYRTDHDADDRDDVDGGDDADDAVDPVVTAADVGGDRDDGDAPDDAPDAPDAPGGDGSTPAATGAAAG